MVAMMLRQVVSSSTTMHLIERLDEDASSMVVAKLIN